ncbi:hypothetical protein ICW40_04040, partial [Actinotalea ferrariae]|uniref:hypothetical protein n=1 Tax=Actinotalea ferrariae TaxID=1386098 RepID=UPI001EB22F28|nr:hypothetical protein [Actinotalea ferrariae]
MTAVRLMRRRARAHRGLLALVVLQVALTTAAVAGITGYVSVAERASVLATLAAAPPGDASLHLQVQLGDDRAAQRAAAEALLEAHLDDEPVVVHTSLASGSVPATAPGAAGPVEVGDVVLWSDDAFGTVAELTSGSWPDADADAADAEGGAAAGTSGSPVPATLEAGAAARLGVGPGDVLTLVLDDASTALVEVTGTWRAPTDPRWTGDPLVTGPADGDDPSGLLVPAGALAALGERGEALHDRWNVTPDGDRLLPGDLPGLGVALAAVAEAFEDDDAVDVGGVRADGDLEATIGALPVRLGGVRGVTTAAVLLVVLAGLIAFGQVARLLADLRLGETVILRSRGTSVAQVTGAAVLEAAVVGVAGATGGVVVAAAFLGTRGSVPTAALTVVGVVAALAATAVLAAR